MSHLGQQRSHGLGEPHPGGKVQRCLARLLLQIHTVALNIHTVALNIHTIALNIHTVALNAHPVALKIHTIALNIHGPADPRSPPSPPAPSPSPSAPSRRRSARARTRVDVKVNRVDVKGNRVDVKGVTQAALQVHRGPRRQERHCGLSAAHLCRVVQRRAPCGDQSEEGQEDILRAGTNRRRDKRIYSGRGPIGRGTRGYTSDT
eukprot:9486967-Pyramimonas_sp.AAC.1